MTHTQYWSDKERDKLRRLFLQGLSRDTLALRLGRSHDAIRRELHNQGLGLTKPATPPKKRSHGKAPTPRAGKSTLPPV